jgi:hypothetical protein
MKQGWKAIKKADADRIAKQPEILNTNFESCIPYTDSINPLHQLNLYYHLSTTLIKTAYFRQLLIYMAADLCMATRN